MSQNFNIAPYYDDFDETKQFYKVLFRPGVAVQTREVNQLQSILQNQVSKLGDHLFKEGSMVIPGQVNYNDKLSYLKVASTNLGDLALTDLEDKFLSSDIAGTGVKAQVIKAIPATESEPITLVLLYTQSNQTVDGVTTADSFVANQTIYVLEDTTKTINVSGGTGVGGRTVAAGLQAGVYYLAGHFVTVPSAVLSVKKYADTVADISVKIGIQYTESLVTPDDDISLYDNAAGSPNAAAPGAHRYKISTEFIQIGLDENPLNFFELIRVEEGVLQSIINASQYNILQETLARRTFDESGNYVVDDFKFDIREDRNNIRGTWVSANYELNDIVTSIGGQTFVCIRSGTSGASVPVEFDAVNTDQTTNIADGGVLWRYTTSPQSNRGLNLNGSSNSLVATFGIGKAYVHGYEVDKLANSNITIPKARDTKADNNKSIFIGQGNYIFVDRGYAQGIPDLSSGPILNLYDRFALRSTGNKFGQGSIVGTARIGWAEPDSRGFVRVGLTNIVMNPDKIFDRDVKSVVAPDYTSADTRTTSYTLTSLVKYAGNTTSSFLQISGLMQTTSQGSTAMIVSSNLTTAYNQEIFIGDVITFGTSSHAATCSWTVTNIINSSTMVLSGPPLTQAAGATTSIHVRFPVQTVFGHQTGVGTRFQSEYRVGDTVFIGPGQTSVVISIASESRMRVSSNVGVILAQTSHGIYYTGRVASFTGDVGGNYQFGINARKLTGLHVLQDYSGGTTVVQSHNALRLTGSNDAKYLSELEANSYVNINNTRVLITKISSNSVAYGIVLESAITGSNTQYPAFKITNGIQDAGNSTMLFPVAPSAVSSITDNVYTVYKTQSVVVTNGGSSAVVTLSTATGDNAAEALATTDVNAFYIAQDGVGTLSAPLQVSTVSVVGTNVTLNISGTFSSTNVRVVYPVIRAAANNTVLGHRKMKTLQFNYPDTFLTTATTAKTTIDLSQSDIYRLVKVYMANSFVAGWDTTVQANATDITSRYNLDNGQRDQFYDIGKLKLRPGNPFPTGSIRVVYDYFSHSAGDYFTKDSYLSGNAITYETIPVYGTVQLSDVLDFRPRVNSSTTLLVNSAPPRFGSTFVADVSYYLGRKEKIFLDGNGSFYNVSGISDLVPTLPAVSDNDNSVPLYDLTLLPYTRNAGYPNVTTTKYDNRRYTMKDIGAIDARVTNLEETTALSLLENKTQSLQIRDNLDSTLERYKTGFFVDNFTDESNAETDGDARFRLDPNKGTLNPQLEYNRVALVEKINYNPGLTTLSETLAANTARAAQNYKITGDLLTINYTTATLLRQTLATTSIAIAPFVVASFLGSMRVIPDKDIYEDAHYKKAIVQVTDNRTAEILAAQVATLRASWSGPYVVDQSYTETLLSTTKTTNFLIPFCRANTILFIAKGLKPNHKFYPYFDGIPINQAVTGAVKLTFDSMPILDFSGKTPKGKTEWQRWRSLYQTVDKTTYDKSLNTYVATRQAWITSYNRAGIWDTLVIEPKDLDASLPSAAQTDDYRLAFGSGYSVWYYATNGALVGSGVVAHQEGTTLHIVNGRGHLSDTYIRAQTAAAGAATLDGTFYVSADGADPKYLPTTRVTAAEALTADAAGNMYSNSEGVIVGIFDLPDTQTIKFTTGQKIITLTDDVNNHPDNWSSKADGTYFVEGYDVTFTTNYKAVHNYVLRPYDPIAQSFKLPSQFTSGAFITDIDVFFHTKPVAELAPVSLELRTCDSTGRPSGTEMVPGTAVTLMPDQVIADPTFGQIPTKFSFRQPVYLMPDKQYAFVLRCDTKNYRVWMATMGQADVRTPTSSYTTQALFGSLFKSQDGTLWTEDQNSDLKFTINRAVFNTADAGATVRLVNSDVRTSQLPSNALTFVHGSRQIQVSHRNHGFSSGDTIRLFSKYWADQYTLNNTVTIQGVPVGQIFGNYIGDTTYFLQTTSNPTLVVSNVTVDSYEVSVSSAAVITNGTTGVTYVSTGGSDLVAQTNIQYQIVRPLASVLKFQPTQVSLSAQMAKSFSYDNDANSFAAYGKITKDLTLNTYTILDTSCAVLTDTVESNSSRFTPTSVTTGGITSNWSDSFIATINLSTSTDHVSPAIEMSTFYLETAGHRIDNPVFATRMPAVLPHSGTTTRVITTTTIANNNASISFNGGTEEITSTTPGLFESVVPGRRITISGSGAAANNFTSTGILVLSVSPDGKTMTVSADLVSASTADPIQIRQYNEFTEEVTTVNATGESKYITKVINLKNPATQIKFQIEACVPSAADFDVYYKTGNNGQNFADIVWRKYIAPFQSGTTSSYTNLVKSDTRGNFTDVEFNISNYDNIGNPVDLGAFTAFQLKLVMRSSNVARVPQFRNLRAIAHA
jgi:hypothetical protein